MAEPTMFLTTIRIKDGALEHFKEAARKTIEFQQSNGPQLFMSLHVDEKEVRAHGIQVHRDSESILKRPGRWQTPKCATSCNTSPPSA